jgi:purine-binding chemotaxis protein CheW
MNRREELSVPVELRELLEKRAERARARPAEEQEQAVLHVAEFPVGEDRVALPLASLRAALPLRAVTPVPLAPPQVIGVVRFQGEVLTAYSLASLLGARGWREDPAVLLVVSAGARLVAVDCEQIPKPGQLAIEQVEQARSRAGGPLAAVLTPDLQEIQLLDLERLLRGKEEGGRAG